MSRLVSSEDASPYIASRSGSPAGLSQRPDSFSSVRGIRAENSNSSAASESPVDKPRSMKSRSFRRSQRSLSSISNGSSSSPAPQAAGKGKDYLMASAEETAWEIINSEIAEWQIVCRTGRPSWWVPTSRWARQGQRTATGQRRAATPDSVWRTELDVDGGHVKRYESERRAATDSFLANPSKDHALAHLIAIQLLGASFTLPPDQIGTYNVPDCHAENMQLPDPRLISALRMHSNYRYSPSFGHQAQNTSPMADPQSACSGSHASTPGEYSDSPEVGSSGRAPSKRIKQRVLHVSSDAGSADGEESPDGRASAWCKQKGVRGPARRISFPDLPRIVPREHPFKWAQHKPRAQRSPHPAAKKDTPGRYRLEPTIRSEPHLVFIQPVMVLVVKRWQTLRKRFGHSLSHGFGDTNSSAGSVQNHAQAPETGSPAASSNSSRRRERARDRHHIHSSEGGSGLPSQLETSDGISSRSRTRFDVHSGSVESSPRYNSPASKPTSTKSPAGSDHLTPAHGDVPQPPGFRYSGILTAYGVVRSTASVPSSPSLPSQETSALSSGTTSPRSEPYSPRPHLGRPHVSPRRGIHRAGRRSQLSEVCTPDDMQDVDVRRNPLSMVGSPLRTPTEGSSSDGTIGLAGSLPIPTTPGNSPAVALLPPESINIALASLREPQSTVSTPGADGMFGRAVAMKRKPRMTRTSSSGTVLYSLYHEGIEVDGLPVGPEARVWEDEEQRGKGKGKRKGGERSFL